jgi:hypothetical protein
VNQPPNYGDAVREFRIVFAPEVRQEPLVVEGKLKVLENAGIVIHRNDTQGSYVCFSAPPESLLFVEAL